MYHVPPEVEAVPSFQFTQVLVVESQVAVEAVVHVDQVESEE
jgi:hypothetical protein